MKFKYVEIENNFFEILSYQNEGYASSFIDFSHREMPELLFGYFSIMTKNSFISSIDGYCPKTNFTINSEVFSKVIKIGSVQVEFNDINEENLVSIRIRNHEELSFYTNESFNKYCVILSGVCLVDLVLVKISKCKTIIMDGDSLVGFILEPN